MSALGGQGFIEAVQCSLVLLHWSPQPLGIKLSGARSESQLRYEQECGGKYHPIESIFYDWRKYYGRRDRALPEILFLRVRTAYDLPIKTPGEGPMSNAETQADDD